MCPKVGQWFAPEVLSFNHDKEAPSETRDAYCACQLLFSCQAAVALFPRFSHWLSET